MRWGRFISTILPGSILLVGLLLRPAPATSAEAADPSGTRVTHVVARDESLALIADLYGVDEASVRDWNRLDGSATVRAGQRLVVYLPDEAPGQEPGADGSDTHPAHGGHPGHRPTPARGRDLPAHDEIDLDLAPPPLPGGEPAYVPPAVPSRSDDDGSGDGGRDGRAGDASSAGGRSGPSGGPPSGGPPSAAPPGGPGTATAATTTAPVTHLVSSGENLSLIARQYGVSVPELRRLNGLSGSTIFAGQKLRLREAGAATHVVERGDALWEIAAAYGLTVRELKSLNGLRGDRIYPGQALLVGRATGGGSFLAEYRVRRGDTLGEIAQLHQMSLSELRAMNDLRGSVIHPGQSLRVRPIPGSRPRGPALLDPRQIDWTALTVELTGAGILPRDNGPYYGLAPSAPRQSSRGYLEEPRLTVPSAYRRAKAMFDAFEERVDEMGRLSDELTGWHIILDPGHGGIDPGSITKVQDGRGDPVYVVEDEYVYDITLRMYVLLRLHGAEVTLTLLSPNHLIRRSEPATRTFVHERNEVWNLASINARNTAKAWPRGGQHGLDTRVRVAREALDGHPSRRTMFLSIHADNSPGTPSVPIVFYHQSRRSTDTRSRSFARDLLPALGAGAVARGRNFGVLRNNPAWVKVLVEVRNVAHADHAWALRFEELRQRDAEKVVRGIRDFVAGS